MNNAWDILIAELAIQGFRLAEGGYVETYSDKKVKKFPIANAISFLTQEIKDNRELFSDIFEEMVEMLTSEEPDDYQPDAIESDLFIFALKDLAKFIEMFEDKDDSVAAKVIRSSLEKDITQFSRKQIKGLPDIKVVVDWLHRLISKLIYIRKLLFFASKGKEYSRSIKMAKGVAGPWSNLDIPLRERTWSWDEEDSNFRSRDKEIRKQRRYRKGLENYNNDGRVGEGHYWRELRNEPFLWKDRATESPYPYRSVLTNWG